MHFFSLLASFMISAIITLVYPLLLAPVLFSPFIFVNLVDVQLPCRICKAFPRPNRKGIRFPQQVALLRSSSSSSCPRRFEECPVCAWTPLLFPSSTSVTSPPVRRAHLLQIFGLSSLSVVSFVPLILVNLPWALFN